MVAAVRHSSLTTAPLCTPVEGEPRIGLPARRGEGPGPASTLRVQRKTPLRQYRAPPSYAEPPVGLPRGEATLEEASSVIANGYLRLDRNEWIGTVEEWIPTHVARTTEASADWGEPL